MLLAPLWGTAQSLTLTVIANSGGSGSNVSHQLEWTLGESVIATVTNGSNTLTQGFHQPHLSVVSVQQLPSDMQLHAFPNPTQGQILMQWQSASASPQAALNTVLVDALGRNLRSWTFAQEDRQAVLDISNLPTATYFLQVWSAGQQIQLFKIVKTSL